MIARRLGAETYGTIVFASAVMLYFQNLAQCGIDLLGVRHVAEDEARIAETAPAILAARTLVAALLCVGLGSGAWLLLPAPDGPVLALFSLTLLAIGPNAKWVFLGLQRARPVAASRAAGESCLLVLVVLLVHEPADITTVPIAQLVGDVIATGAMLWWLARGGLSLFPSLSRLREHAPEVARIFRRAAPLVGNVLLGLTIYNSDLLFLRFFADRETVGYYGAAYQLVSFLNNLAMAYSISLLPALTRVALDLPKRDAMVHDSLAYVVAFGLPIAVGGSMLAVDIITLFFGEGFAASGSALQLLVWCIPFILLKEIWLIALLVREREGTVMRMTALAVGLNVALNLLLIPPYGMIGAALATVVTEAARALLAGFFARGEGYVLPGLGRFWKCAVASAVMAGVLVAVGSQSLFVTIAIGAATYVGALLAVGGIGFRDGLPVLKV